MELRTKDREIPRAHIHIIDRLLRADSASRTDCISVSMGQPTLGAAVLFASSKLSRRALN